MGNIFGGSTGNKAQYSSSQAKTTGKHNNGPFMQPATTFKPNSASFMPPVAPAASNQQMIDNLLAENASLQQKIGYGSGLIDENVYIAVLRQYNADLHEFRNKMEQEYQAR